MTLDDRYQILKTVFEKERINPMCATSKQASRVARIFQNILAVMENQK